MNRFGVVFAPSPELHQRHHPPVRENQQELQHHQSSINLCTPSVRFPVSAERRDESGVDGQLLNLVASRLDCCGKCEIQEDTEKHRT